jgi:hypothetical protein
MGGKGSGISNGRLPSVALVQAMGWSVGTVLTSKEWVCPRQIVSVVSHAVRLKTIHTKQRSQHSLDYAQSFPSDVAVLVT